MLQVLSLFEELAGPGPKITSKYGGESDFIAI
jgi:hypothetical protein